MHSGQFCIANPVSNGGKKESCKRTRHFFGGKRLLFNKQQQKLSSEFCKVGSAKFALWFQATVCSKVHLFHYFSIANIFLKSKIYVTRNISYTNFQLFSFSSFPRIEVLCATNFQLLNRLKNCTHLTHTLDKQLCEKTATHNSFILSLQNLFRELGNSWIWIRKEAYILKMNSCRWLLGWEGFFLCFWS